MGSVSIIHESEYNIYTTFVFPLLLLFSCFRYILTTGAITALCASLLGSLLAQVLTSSYCSEDPKFNIRSMPLLGSVWVVVMHPCNFDSALVVSFYQPRIFMAMARDGLLPAFFAEINPRTHVPVKNTIVIGVLAASLAFFMDVSQLSEMVSSDLCLHYMSHGRILTLQLMAKRKIKVSLISLVLVFIDQVSVGTLMAFTAVAACVLVLRYVPPDGVPLPSSSQTWTDSVESRVQPENVLEDAIESSDSPLLGDERDQGTKI